MIQIYSEIGLSMFFDNYRGTIQYTRYNSFQESIVLMSKKPSRFMKFFLTRNYVVIKNLEFHNLKEVAKTSNQANLKFANWLKCRDSFSPTVREFLSKYLEFNDGDKYFLGERVSDELYADAIKMFKKVFHN